MISNLLILLYKVLFNKISILIFIVLFPVVIFHLPIEDLLTRTVINHVLAYVESTWYNDTIFYLFAIATLVYAASKWRQYTLSAEIIFFYCILAVVYLYYRLVAEPWTFIPFVSFNNIKYADIIPLLAIANSVLLLVKVKKSEYANKLAGFVADEPIVAIEQDIFGYTTYVEALAAKIRVTHLGKAFAIGVNGKWGFGKSSFMELLKHEMADDSVIQIAFDPWNSSNPKAIIQDFFETLQEGIAPYHSSLSRSLVSYSNKLVALNDNTVSQSILASVTAFTGFDSLNHLFKNINKALERIDKKIIVYINDLDRLDKDEIMEVIRLIRNTANFYNTVFVLGYDRNYVVSAIRQHNPYHTEQFLEKIFQLEISLPYFPKEILRKRLADLVKRSISEEYHEVCENHIIGSAANMPVYLHDWLESMRDVTRLTNSFTLNFNKLAGEVDFNDFLKLELLRMKYPFVYSLLYSRKDEFLELTDQASNNPYYELKFGRVSNGIGMDEFVFHIASYLKAHHQELSIPDEEINKIVSFLQGIFPGIKTRGFYQVSSLSITSPYKFDIYFAYRLLQGNLSEVEFSIARRLDQTNFNATISKWVEQKTEYQLQHRFKEIDTFVDREDYEKTIRAILHLARLKSLFPTKYSKLVGYEGSDLKKKLSDYNGRISNELYGGGIEGRNKLHVFVKELFENAPFPYTYDADFIHFLYDEYTQAFPLTKIELKELLLSYLRIYCKQVSHFNDQILYLHSRCILVEWEPEDANVQDKVERIPEEANDIIKDFILNKDLDGFLRHSIQFYNNGNRFALGIYPSRIFGSRDKFKMVLQAQDENRWKYLKEFKDFLSAFEAQGGSNFIEYKFSDIPIDTRA